VAVHGHVDAGQDGVREALHPGQEARCEFRNEGQPQESQEEVAVAERV